MISYFNDDVPDLLAEQEQEFLPLYDKIRDLYGINLNRYKGLFDQSNYLCENSLSETLKNINTNCLLTLDLSSSILKSTGLALLCLKNELSVIECLRLSRLEENFQSARYGAVEGHHDLNEKVLLVSLLAQKIFYQLSCN